MTGYEVLESGILWMIIRLELPFFVRKQIKISKAEKTFHVNFSNAQCVMVVDYQSHFVWRYCSSQERCCLSGNLADCFAAAKLKPHLHYSQF